jgi:hypothetical protein
VYWDNYKHLLQQITKKNGKKNMQSFSKVIMLAHYILFAPIWKPYFFVWLVIPIKLIFLMQLLGQISLWLGIFFNIHCTREMQMCRMLIGVTNHVGTLIFNVLKAFFFTIWASMLMLCSNFIMRFTNIRVWWVGF